MAFIHAADRGHDLAWGAIPALKGIVIDKCLLHWMQIGTVGQAFDRCDVVTFSSNGEREAGQHAPSTEQHRTSTALAVIAALFCAGQSQTLAQQIKERGSHINGETVL